MKGLFQCPPWASPWGIMDASLPPCKGKSLQVLGKNDNPDSPRRKRVGILIYIISMNL